MRLSASEVDWSKLSERARWALENVMPKLSEDFTEKEIAVELGVDVDEVIEAHELLEAEVQALAGRVVIRRHTEDELASLAASLEEHGQMNPIYRASDGVIVEGKARYRILARLGADPWIIDLEAPSDELEALSLALDVARRQLTAGERRGIARVELLLDPTRSDRAIAAIANVAPNTIKAVRKELESTAQIAQLPDEKRRGADGRTRSLPEREPEPNPLITVRVRMRRDDVQRYLGGAWNEEPWRGVEVRPGIFELQFNLGATEEASIEDRASIVEYAFAVDALFVSDQGATLLQILGDATEVFGRPIVSVDDLNAHEASWCLDRLRELETLGEKAAAR